MKLNLFTLKTNRLVKVTSLAVLSLLALSVENIAQAQTIFALRSNELLRFNAATPTIINSTNPITGMDANLPIVAIDARPATGELFALGYNNTSGAFCLYTLNKNSGAAMMVGTAGLIMPNMMPVSFDFNPSVDRIRLTGFNGSNYRLNPNTGALLATDGNLNFAAGDVHATRTPNIVTGAYTNNYIGTTSTVLYNVDTVLRALTTQNPPNAGTQNTVVNAIADLQNVRALDIHFDSSNAEDRAFVMRSGSLFNNSTLGRLNLTTGEVNNVGAIGISGGPVLDIAVDIRRSVATQMPTNLGVALNANNMLLTFDQRNPGFIVKATAITGIIPNQTMVGMDFRPANGTLWGLGYNRSTGFARLYEINVENAEATAMGTDTFRLELGTGKVSFDFNPTVDRIRLISENGMNYRLNPITANVAATDSMIRFASADANAGRLAVVQAIGYTNNFSDASTTELFVIERSTGFLAIQNPPNDGRLNTQSSLSINGLGNMEMDILSNRSNGTNRGFLIGAPSGNMGSNLYNLELNSGVLTLIGKIGQGIDVRDIAIFPDTSRPLSVSRSTQLKTLKLYPNPVENETNISFALEQAQEINVAIFDALGRKVRSQAFGTILTGAQQMSINTQGLTKGVYQLVINGKQEPLGSALFIKQ